MAKFGEGSFLYQHDNASVHKVRSIHKWFVNIGGEELDCPAQSPDLNPTNTFGMNWNADCELDIIAQHLCPTSQMLLWLNGSKSLQQCSNIEWKAFPEEWRLFSQQRGDHINAQSSKLYINAHDFGMRCWTSRCPHTFGHVVCAF